MGLACMIGLVLGRRYDGCFHVSAGCRSRCPHQRRERGLGDRARARLASDGVVDTPVPNPFACSSVALG